MQPQETYLLFAHQRWGTAKYQIFAPPSTDAAAHRTWTRASQTATSAGEQTYDNTSPKKTKHQQNHFASHPVSNYLPLILKTQQKKKTRPKQRNNPNTTTKNNHTGRD